MSASKKPIVLGALALLVLASGAYLLLNQDAAEPAKTEPTASGDKSESLASRRKTNSDDPTPPAKTDGGAENETPSAVKNHGEVVPPVKTDEGQDPPIVSLGDLLSLHREAFLAGEFDQTVKLAERMKRFAPLSGHAEFGADIRGESEFLRKRMLLDMLTTDNDSDLLWTLLREAMPAITKFNDASITWNEGELQWFEGVIMLAMRVATRARGGLETTEELLTIFEGSHLRTLILQSISHLPTNELTNYRAILRREASAGNAQSHVAGELLMRVLPDEASRLALLAEAEMRPHLGQLLTVALSEKLISKDEAVKHVTNLLNEKTLLPETAIVLDILAQSFPEEGLELARDLRNRTGLDSGLLGTVFQVMARDGQPADFSVLLSIALGTGEEANSAAMALCGNKRVDEASALFDNSGDENVRSMALRVLVADDREKYLDVGLSPAQPVAVRRTALESLIPNTVADQTRLRSLGESDTSSTVRLVALRTLYSVRDTSTLDYFDERGRNESDPVVRAEARSMAETLRRLKDAGR